MDDRLRRISRADDGLVLLRQARDHGVTEAAVRWALRSGELVRVGPGGFAAVATWEAGGRTGPSPSRPPCSPGPAPRRRRGR